MHEQHKVHPGLLKWNIDYLCSIQFPTNSIPGFNPVLSKNESTFSAYPVQYCFPAKVHDENSQQ